MSAEEKTDPDYGHYSIMALIGEMKRLDMNPQALFDVAARDMMARYGTRAMPYARALRDRMIEENHPDEICIWQEIYGSLKTQAMQSFSRVH